MNRRRNSFGLRWNISKHCFEIVIRSRFYDPQCKRDTHLADSFFNCFMQNWNHCAMWYAYIWPQQARALSLVDQSKQYRGFWIDDKIHNFCRLSSLNWTSRTRYITCRCTTRFKFIHPTVYSHKRWCRCAMNIIQLALISFGVKLFICRCLITARNSFFSILQKIQRLFVLIVYRNKMRWIPLKIW